MRRNTQKKCLRLRSWCCWCGGLGGSPPGLAERVFVLQKPYLLHPSHRQDPNRSVKQIRIQNRGPESTPTLSCQSCPQTNNTRATPRLIPRHRKFRLR